MYTRRLPDLSSTALYDELREAYRRTQVLERHLSNAAEKGHNALEVIKAGQLSRAYEKAQMLGIMYMVQRSVEDDQVVT